MVRKESVKFNSMDPEMAYAGLTDEARKFIETEGKWTHCPPHVIAKIGSPAYLLAMNMETKHAMYALLIRGKQMMVANLAGRVLRDDPEDLLMFLLKYPLKDGTEAEARKQAEVSGVLCVALMIDGEDKFKWTEVDLQAALENVKEE